MAETNNATGVDPDKEAAELIAADEASKKAAATTTAGATTTATTTTESTPATTTTGAGSNTATANNTQTDTKVTYSTPPKPKSMLHPLAAKMFNVDYGQGVGYTPPQEQQGRFITEASKQAFVPGAPIDLALTTMLLNDNATRQQAYAASMGGARNRQLIEAQNDPYTYELAKLFMADGMPADKALHSAMTQYLAQRGNYLGLGASLPAAQKALDETNNRDAALALLFGLPYQGYQTGGAYNIRPTGVYSYSLNDDGTASARYNQGVANGVTGWTLANAIGLLNPGSPTANMINTLFGGAGRGGNTRSNSTSVRVNEKPVGTPRQIQEDAAKASRDASNTPHGF